MKEYRMLFVLGGVLVAAYLFDKYTKKKAAEEAGSQNFGGLSMGVAQPRRGVSVSPSVGGGIGVASKKLPKGTKMCNCAYLKKSNKVCSKDVFCNNCCEGAGDTGHI